MIRARIDTLQALASEVRKDVVKMVGIARSGSIVTPLSITDVLVYLYWEAMIIHPENCQRRDRDHFFLGMCAAVPSFYAVLARRGYFDREALWHYKRLGAILQPLPQFGRVPGVDAPCVSSGCELSLVVGLAESLSAEGLDRRIFCLIEKEECANPDFWAEVKNIGMKGLNKIALLIAVQDDGGGIEKAAIGEYVEMFTAAGWQVDFSDGHDYADMERSFVTFGSLGSLPTVVFVSTLTGKGLSLPETRKVKKSGLLSLQEMDRALEELENGG